MFKHLCLNNHSLSDLVFETFMIWCSLSGFVLSLSSKRRLRMGRILLEATGSRLVRYTVMRIGKVIFVGDVVVSRPSKQGK